MTPKARRDWPARVAIRWDDTHRLILATYADTDEPFLADLTDAEGGAELAALVDLTAATNARLMAQAGRLPGGPGPYELVFETPYSKIVNAAFTYPGPAGARFHDPHRGAWYAARAVTTSLAEVVFHRQVQLAETDWWHDTVDYQDYLADIHADGFADLTDGDTRTRKSLAPNSYAAGQALAATLLADGSSGVIYPSVRDRTGTCVAVFKPAMVGHVRAGDRYTLTWTGTRTPTVALAA